MIIIAQIAIVVGFIAMCGVIACLVLLLSAVINNALYRGRR